jgi:hypothetical protein
LRRINNNAVEIHQTSYKTIMNDNAPTAGNASPFERIRKTNAVGAEYWSSREFAGVLGYADYRNFEQVIGKARLACFNSGQRIEDHFGDITEMIEIGKGGWRKSSQNYSGTWRDHAGESAAVRKYKET